MSYLLFIDESGIDRKSPYQVLAGICVEDKDLWNFIQRVHEREEAYFGTRMTHGVLELKGNKLLDRKVFQHASQHSSLNAVERVSFVREFMEENRRVKGTQENPAHKRIHFAAFGQAKLEFVKSILNLCLDFRIQAFASIIPQGNYSGQGNELLRKDYNLSL